MLEVDYRDVDYRADITSFLFYVHWLPVCFWAQYKVLVLTFIDLYSLGTTYLKDLLLLYEFATVFFGDLASGASTL